MSKLPVISGMKTVKAFQKVGWIVKRQTGSHMIMERSGSIATLSVPNHKEIKRGKKFDQRCRINCGRILRVVIIHVATTFLWKKNDRLNLRD